LTALEKFELKRAQDVPLEMREEETEKFELKRAQDVPLEMREEETPTMAMMEMYVLKEMARQCASGSMMMYESKMRMALSSWAGRSRRCWRWARRLQLVVCVRFWGLRTP
jgi:hypothetical protein